jgi:hypothetical protein
MTLYIRQQLRNFVLQPWPDLTEQELHERVVMVEAINRATREHLVSLQDMHITLWYAFGYEQHAHEEIIRRVLLVLATLTGYTDMAYVRRILPNATKTQQLIAAKQMHIAPLWIEKEKEPDNESL